VTKTSQWSASAIVRGTGSSSWLVLGQSLSAGWHASADGKSLGAPILIDGYANGWKLPASPPGSIVNVSFVWTPQHVVNIAQLLSLLGLLLVIALIIWPSKRRAAWRDAAFTVPRLASPFRYSGAPRSWLVTAIVSIGVGLAVGFFTAPINGLCSLVLCAVGLRVPWSRFLLFFGSVGALALAGLLTAYGQHKTIYPWNIGWPQHFPVASTCAWVAMALLIVDGAVELLRERFADIDGGSAEEYAPEGALLGDGDRER
jgi:hypothetical protein